eukprot:GABV01004328.1.p1 GENE.GABV01004328.1~~GABV01004328.1.p1  ORF type:complete len:139 (+),score=39.14 GABV01004328.1:37-417(+)
MQRLLVSRSASVESHHPVGTGVVEKVLSIPGAKEILLTIDSRSLDTNVPGVSITLYRKPNQTEPIDGGHFASVPDVPIRVQGDSVVIAYDAGYSGSAWGFKCDAKAFVEEITVELPWFLDLTNRLV